MDLSLKQQFIDVVIVRRGPGEIKERLPDGLENLAEHNLLSYKSLQEPLDEWTIDELIGHYVNYRKQVSPRDAPLLPPERFGLYAVGTRFPEKLASQVALAARQAGVYEVAWGTHTVRVLVLSQMAEGEHNAIWHLFSGVPQKVAVAAQHYRRHLPDASTILNRLFKQYELEGIAMPYTLEDFRRDARREILEELPPEERLRGLSPEERLRGLSPEELEQVRALLERQEQQHRPKDKR